MSDQSDQVEPHYQVEKVTDKKYVDGKLHYQIKWVGWKKKTWQPIQFLTNIVQMIHEFEDSLKLNRKALLKAKVDKGKKTRKEQLGINQKDYQIQVATKRGKSGSEKESMASSSSKGIGQSSSQGLGSQQSQHSQQEMALNFKERDQPRMKVTRNWQQEEPQTKKKYTISVYTNKVKQVRRVEKQANKWMAQIVFQQLPQVSSWVERDLLRLLQPYPLLLYYQQLAHE